MYLYGQIYMVTNAPAIIVVRLYVHAIGLWYDPIRGVREIGYSRVAASVEYVTTNMVPTKDVIPVEGRWKKMYIKWTKKYKGW